MDPRETLVTYEGLPGKHGGAHALRDRDIFRAWHKVVAFVEACAGRPTNIEAAYLLTTGEGIPLSFSLRTWAVLLLRFGPPSVPFRSYGHPAQTTFRFRVPARSLDRDIGSFTSLPAMQPAHYTYPLTFAVTYHLKFRSPTTGKALPFQDPSFYMRQTYDYAHGLELGQSLIHLTLSPKPTLYAFLSLPCNSLDKELYQLVTLVKAHFPTKTSEHGWRIWRLNKEKTAYYQRALPRESAT